MLVINATFKCVPGKREELREMIRQEGIDAASRAEEGNYKYDLYMSTEDPDDLLLVEHWKDVDAWKYHRTLPHYARLSELKEVCVVSTEALHSFTAE